MPKNKEKLMPPVRPGEILLEDFMKPLGLSVNRLALELHVPATRVGEIVHGRRRVTAETCRIFMTLKSPDAAAKSPKLSGK